MHHCSTTHPHTTHKHARLVTVSTQRTTTCSSFSSPQHDTTVDNGVSPNHKNTSRMTQRTQTTPRHTTATTLTDLTHTKSNTTDASHPTTTHTGAIGPVSPQGCHTVRSLPRRRVVAGHVRPFVATSKRRYDVRDTFAGAPALGLGVLPASVAALASSAMRTRSFTLMRFIAASAVSAPKTAAATDERTTNHKTHIQ